MSGCGKSSEPTLGGQNVRLQSDGAIPDRTVFDDWGEDQLKGGSDTD